MSESNYTLEQVEFHLKKIQSKHDNRKKYSCRKTSLENLQESLEHLHQELDYLNISQLARISELKSPESLQMILTELVDSTFDLIKLHRDVIGQQDELIEKNTRLHSGVTTMTKQIDVLKKNIASKDRTIEILRGKHYLEMSKNDELTAKLGQANKKIGIIQQESRTNRTKQLQLINKENDANKKKKEKLSESCGKYISQDMKLVQLLSSAQENELKLKVTVSKLQNTNQHLLQELLELRSKTIA